MEPNVTQIFPTTDKAEKVTDGFANFAAKLGVTPKGQTPGADNLLSQGHYQFNLVTRNRVALEAAYRGSWIVGQVIDAIAEDMTREGIKINTNEDPETLDEITTEMNRLKIWSSTCETIQWGRLYGGAVAVMQIEGQDLATPLDPDSIAEGQFLGLSVYDRWQLNPSLNETISSGPDLGLPKFYDIVLGSNINDPGEEPGKGEHTESATGRVRVHHSRCLRNIGIKLPFWQSITEMMWGESVLERMWDRLIEFDTATASTGNLISRAQLRTVGIAGLREILAAGGKAQESLIAQFEYMRQLQNNEGITLLDKEDTFASTAYSFAGLSDVLMQFGQQVSGAAKIPLVRLFGQSPAGMSATGESDIRLYYDSIKAQQESQLRNFFTVLLKVIWRSTTGQEPPEDLTFTFTPLWQMSAIDKATVAKTNTDTIVEAHQEGAIDTATMMKELKQSSGDTGLFSHITDDAIEEAENEEPPMPGDVPGAEGAAGLEDPADPKEKIKQASGDSAWRKIKRFLALDAGGFKESEHPRAKNGEFGSGGGGGSSSSSGSGSSKKKDPTEQKGLIAPEKASAHAAMNTLEKGDHSSLGMSGGYTKTKGADIKTSHVIPVVKMAQQEVNTAVTPALGKLSDALKKKGIDVVSSSARPKELDSIMKKMQGKWKDKTLSQGTDFIGARMVLKSQKDIERMLPIIEKETGMKPIEHDNFSKTGKNHGYRAHHILLKTPNGAIVEMQIQTVNQRAAQKYTHPIYKPSDAHPEFKGMSEKELSQAKKYGEDVSDYLASVDQGKPGTKPKAPEFLKAKGLEFDWKKANLTAS